MAPQRWKVPISIVVVNGIDLTDWLDIVVDDLNHWSSRADFSYIFWFPNVWKWTDGYRYTSFTYLNRSIWIDIIMNSHSCMKHTNKITSLIYR